ncbi:MAG: YDG domain-containing protein, partial [Bacteroidia bacterium]|nr:YDG domain-containing protein [Bacteroidia bacterium]
MIRPYYETPRINEPHLPSRLESGIERLGSCRGNREGSSRKLFAVSLSLFAAVGHTEPIGGQIVSGSGSITQSGDTTTINQTSPNLSANWQSFNIAPSETVNFVQPTASAIAVNRIADTNGTQILGHLNANGQVYLINPNGILFGQGAQVNVGGLVASTLDVNDASLNSNSRTFSGSGTGSVVNQGTINAADGGSVALLGNTVSNQGTITAQLGTVALGAGNAVTVTFNGNNLVKMQVDQSTLDNLAENKQLIRADGGQVIMSAGAQNALLASVVNNEGVIEARTVENHDGAIVLLGGMAAGTVNVGGTLDASAPNGGHSGFIETSASNVVIQSGATVTAGDDGAWLIDPTNITIDSTAASTIAGALNTGTNVTQTTSSGGVDTGDITVASAITWTGAGTLILNADHDINININADIIGSNGGLTLNAANTISATAAVNVKNFNLDNGNWNQLATSLPSFNAYNFRINGGSFLRALSGSGTGANPYLLTDVYGLQGMDTYLSSSFALANNIDASGTVNWNGGGGFDPIFNIGTSSYNPFTGTFDGQSYAIDGLNIVRSYAAFQGLFGYTKSATISNVALTNAYVVGTDFVGALIGWGVDTNLSNISSSGTVYTPGASTSSGTGGVAGVLERGYGVTANITADNVHSTANVTGAYSVGGVFGAFGGGVANNITATGNVSGGQDNAGGLLGTLMLATLTNGHATGTVSANNKAGGLIGFSQNSTISDTYATGNITASHWVGGLVGEFESSTLTNSSHVSGNVSGVNYVGGLVGKVVSGSLGNVWASGAVTSSYIAGGLVGENVGGSISVAHATGNVSGSVSVGGLVGTNAGTIGLSYATGAVNCVSQYCGGLAGLNQGSGSIANAYATGNVTGGIYAGGLVGINASVIAKSYATGNVANTDRSGGLVGKNYLGSIDTSFATGNVTGFYAGGLVGENTSLINNSYATGSARAIYATDTAAGGLVGLSDSAGTSSVISNSYASGAVYATHGSTMMGGVIGFNGDSTIQDSYWNTETTGQSVAVGATYASVTGGAIAVGTINNVAGLTTAQMHAQSNFTTLDFTNKWFMYEGYTAPLLRDFMTALTITANNVTKTYDGLAYNGSGGVTYSVTPNMANLTGTLSYTGGINAGSYAIAPGGLHSNQQGYIISYINGALTVNPKAVNLTGSRVYDGTANVAAGALTLSGLVGTETVSLTGTGTLADKNVGTAKAVTLGTLALGDGTGLASNYTFTGGTKSLDVTAKALTVSATGSNKVYDGTTTGTVILTDNRVAGDALTLSNTSAHFSDKNAAAGKTVNVSGINVTGTDAGNYTFNTGASATADITARGLAVTAAGANKVYDGTTTAAVTLGDNRVAGDALTLSNAAANFTDKNAAAGKTVNVSGINVTGTDAGNYTFNTGASATADITARGLAVT